MQAKRQKDFAMYSFIRSFQMAIAEILLSNKITESKSRTSLRTAALSAGISLLVMVIAAHSAVYPVLPTFWLDIRKSFLK